MEWRYVNKLQEQVNEGDFMDVNLHDNRRAARHNLFLSPDFFISVLQAPI